MYRFIFYSLINIYISVGGSKLIEQYYGCYQTFYGNKININLTSVTSCLDGCKSKSNSLTFAALKNGNECYCGDDFSTSTQESDCSIPCKNNDICGGQHHYSIYSVCPPGYYGQNCNTVCNSCHKSVPCTRYHGNCYKSKCSRRPHEPCDAERLLFQVNECKNCSHNEECISLRWDNTNYKTCACKKGYFKTSIYSQCSDIDECYYNKHSCEATISTCRNNEGGYDCECKVGYQNNSNNVCSDIDECRTKHSCETRISTCVNNVGSYSCQCNTGYENRGHNNLTCHDFDECRNNKHSCDATTSTCRNTEGGYDCECRTGYQKNSNKVCQDIDECITDHSCETKISTCVNNVGSYSCQCNAGYENKGYNLKCYDINECSPGKNNCDGKTTNCQNNPGSYQCNCKEGYRKGNNGYSCIDFDECKAPDWNRLCNTTRSTCVNTDGGYYCQCNDRYEHRGSDKKICHDIDECSTYKDDCDKLTTTCNNIDGGYQCICISGYQYIHGSFKSCEDIDECKTSNLSCNTTKSTCVNTDRDYYCQCNDGYENRGSDKKTCHDIDECKQTEKFDFTVICTNTPGRVTFSCSDGFYLDEELDKYTCKANSIAGKVAGGLLVVLVLVHLAIAGIYLWRKKHISNYKEEIPPTNSCELNNTFKELQIQLVPVNNSADAKQQSTTKIRIQDLSDHIRTTSEKDCNAFENEFKTIPKVVELLSMKYAEQPFLKPKNRFQNIFPYDHNRVVLTVNGEQYSDYINASHITGFENTVAMVAAQGPTDQTVNDFWRMINEQNVNIIIMLTQLVENGKNKCTLYWPDAQGNCLQFGNTLVTNTMVVTWDKFVRRDLKITNQDTHKTSKITQWQYLGWPDHGVPTDVQSFLRFRNNVRAWMDRGGKTLVHCSAGVGRTGCFIAIDVLLEEAANRGSVDIVSCVTELRHQRPHMVQTAVQYDFIYLALKLAFEEHNYYIPIPTFHKKYLSISKTNKNGKSKIAEEYELLTKQISENINNISSKKWKAFFAGGIDSPSKYIFASFPSESDVDKFWDLCFQHCKVIIILDHVKDYRLPFMPNKIKSLIIKESTLELTNSLPLGVLSLDTVSVFNSEVNENVYENKAMMTKNQSRQFSVIRVCANNDIAMKELFLAIKTQVDLVLANIASDDVAKSVFAISRGDNKMASFYIACCKLFDQMETFKEVSVFQTVLDLHKEINVPIITKIQYKMLYEIIDKEAIAKKPFQLL